jgi:small neutral amino acid transporter SnatA (MarC family)
MDINLAFGLLLVKAFIMLFVIMDPSGNIPVFMALTKGMSERGRKKELNLRVGHNYG